jgi:heat shock protein HslJ
LGKDWQLTALTIAVPPFQGAVPEEQQPNYTITFNQDATFSAKADCNTLAGGYTTPDATASTGTLTITPGPINLIACPAGSLSNLYIDALGQSATYAIADNLLTMTLVDGGTLQYK